MAEEIDLAELLEQASSYRTNAGAFFEREQSWTPERRELADSHLTLLATTRALLVKISKEVSLAPLHATMVHATICDLSAGEDEFRARWVDSERERALAN